MASIKVVFLNKIFYQAPGGTMNLVTKMQAVNPCIGQENHAAF